MNTTFTVLVPSQAAWSTFLRAAARANITMDDALYEALFNSLIVAHHWGGADVTEALVGEGVSCSSHAACAPWGVGVGMEGRHPWKGKAGACGEKTGKARYKVGLKD